MRHVTDAGLSRGAAPDFALIAGLELLRMRQATDLAFRLFVELCAMCNHGTGAGSTSYAVLAALCTPHRAPTANKAPGTTPKRLRGALAELVALGLVRLDRARNEAAKGLFFEVQPRGRISASANKRGRQQGRPSDTPETASSSLKPRKPARGAADAGQTAGQGVQEKKLTPLPPSSSTATPPGPAELRALAKRLRSEQAARRAGGDTRAPKGAGTSPG